MPGACECDKNIYRISYEDLTTELKKNHSEWAPLELRREAAKLFRPRYRQDAASVKQELLGDQITEGPGFTLEDGKIFYPQYGQSLEEFHNRQLRLTPDKYSLEQHQTSILIQEAFKNGATEVVTCYYRPGEDHRDLLVMNYDPKTGIGKTTIINHAQDGKYHDFSIIHTLAKAKFGTYKESKPVDKAFVLTNTLVEESKMRRAAIDVKKQFVASTEATLNIHKVDVEQNQDNQIMLEVDHKRTLIQERPIIASDIKPTSLRESFQKKQKEMQQTVLALRVVSETNVASGALPVLLSSLTKEFPKPIRAFEKSIMRHARKETRTLRRKEQKLKQTLVQKEKSPMIFRKQEVKRRVQLLRHRRRLSELDETKLVFLTKRETKFQEKKEKKKTFRRRETVAFQLLKMKKAAETIGLQRKENGKRGQLEHFNLLVRLARKLQRLEKPKKHEKNFVFRRAILTNIDVINKPIELMSQHKRKKEETLKFLFAWEFWFILLSFPRKRESINGLQRADHELPIESGMKNLEKTFVSKEPTPWILWSIIWYLAMIREQGIISKTIIQNSGTAIKQRKTNFQPFGVIFMFHALDE